MEKFYNVFLKQFLNKIIINFSEYPSTFIKLLLLIHFAYIFNVFFDVKRKELQVMFLVSTCISSYFVMA
jgi:hypothetical protein